MSIMTLLVEQRTKAKPDASKDALESLFFHAPDAQRIERSQNDLHSGLFTFTSEALNVDEIIKSGTCIFSVSKDECPGSVTWRYAQPRAVEHLLFSPLPVGLETPSGTVTVSLEMFDDITMKYIPVKNFRVSELSQTMIKIQNLPGANHSFSRVYQAAQWRMTLPGDPPEVDLEFQAACLTPFALCGSCRVDSFYTYEMIPMITSCLTIGELGCQFMDDSGGPLCNAGLQNSSLVGDFWPKQKILSIDCQTQIFADILNRRNLHLEKIIQGLQPRVKFLVENHMIGKTKGLVVDVDANFGSPEIGSLEKFYSFCESHEFQQSSPKICPLSVSRLYMILLPIPK